MGSGQKLTQSVVTAEVSADPGVLELRWLFRVIPSEVIDLVYISSSLAVSSPQEEMKPLAHGSV